MGNLLDRWPFDGGWAAGCLISLISFFDELHFLVIDVWRHLVFSSSAAW